MNKGRFIKRMGRVLVTGLTMLVLVLLPGVGQAAPEPPEEIIITETQFPTSSDEDDDILGGKLEVGTEYVQWYPGSGDIPSTRESAHGLYYGLDSRYWQRRGIYSNSRAWEEHFKRSSRGGREWQYIDQWDLAMFVGHGTERRWSWRHFRWVGGAWDPTFRRYGSALVFGNGGNNHDDSYLVPGDAYRSWGNSDLEWMAMHACLVLSNRSRSYWAASMNGLHQILGFQTVSYGGSRRQNRALGEWFAKYINRDYRIYRAWFIAADITQPRWWRVKARVLAEDYGHWYDRRSYMYPDSPDRWYWYKDHWVTSGRRATSLSPATLDYELPVYEVLPQPLTDDRVNHLAASFGMTQTTSTLDEEMAVRFITDLSEERELTVDDNGMFYFVDHERLWEEDPNQPARLAVGEAQQIADDFLLANALMPEDAQFHGVISDTLTGMEIVTNTMSTLDGDYITVTETITESFPVAMQVVYSRIISHPTASGIVGIPVEGPGATIKVYLSGDGQVVGAMGGWREVTQTATLASTPIITESQAAALIQSLGSSVSLVEPLVQAEQITVTNASVGYYEMSMAETQSQLTPVYILNANYGVSNTTVMSAGLYLPASPALLPPLASITSHTEDTPYIFIGETLELAAADASENLSALGYGDSLDFSLGQPPYTYTWKLDSTSEVIGSGRTIDHSITFSDYASLGPDYDVPLLIILEVTDSAGKTNTTERSFYFAETLDVQKVYLPTVLRQ